MKPSSPTGLSATGVTGTSVTLSWTASTDDSWVTGYEVYRDGVKIGTTPGTTIENTKDVEPGRTYSYTVKAYDVAGNLSDESVPAVVTTPDGVQSPQTQVTPDSGDIGTDLNTNSDNGSGSATNKAVDTTTDTTTGK